MHYVSLGNYQAVPFQKFGRIQDMFSKTSTVSMLDSSNLDRFVFLPDKITEFKKMLDQLASQSQLSILQIVGSTPYDGGTSNAIILESKNSKGVVYMRYWIDPSRGYICPLAQQFEPESGKLLKEYTAKNYFLHEKSGLWYPQECEEKTWDASGNILQESKLYQINPTTFQINQPVSDEEFYIDVAEGMSVVDDRDAPKKGHPYKGVSYRAKEKGTLSLAAGGLDLSEMSWLERSFSVADYEPPRGGATVFWVRCTLTLSGLVLIFIALRRVWLKRKKTPPTAMLFLPILVFAGIGCSKESATVSMNSSVFAEPAILDFGNVRPTDSPVEISFDVCNNGDKDVNIMNVLSGCGCTVIDIPHEPISSGGRATLTTKVNLWGRFGVFENDLVVTTTTEPDLRVHIRCNIETDIWLNEASTRYTVAPKERYAIAILTLHTVKYPNIVFADTPQTEGVEVNEISRETKNGQTVIRFLVAVDVGANDLVARHVSIVPEDESIAALSISVYCYRDEDNPFATTLITTQLNLGIIKSGEMTDCRIYGDPDMLVTVEEINLRDVPDVVRQNVKTSFRFDKTDGEKSSDSFLTVVLLPENILIGSLVDGQLVLKTRDDREFPVALRMEIK